MNNASSIVSLDSESSKLETSPSFENEFMRIVEPLSVELGDLTLKTRSLVMAGTGEWGIQELAKKLANGARFERKLEMKEEVIDAEHRVAEALDQNSQKMHRQATPFFVEPTLKNYADFLDSAPQEVICRIPIIITEPNILEEQARLEDIDDLSKPLMHMKLLFGSIDGPAILKRKEEDKTVYELIFAERGEQGVISRERSLATTDPDVQHTLTNPAVYQNMFPSPVIYPAFRKACVCRITVTEDEKEEAVSAEMEYIATIVPIGTPYNLNWYDPADSVFEDS